MSLPSWERGLKLLIRADVLRRALVAPLVGAWVEITDVLIVRNCRKVAPLVGAWVEIADNRR